MRELGEEPPERARTLAAADHVRAELLEPASGFAGGQALRRRVEMEEEEVRRLLGIEGRSGLIDGGGHAVRRSFTSL
jgi:hypothetical protein